MELIKQLKYNAIITSLLYIMIGLVLIVNPETTALLLCNIIGSIFIVLGVISVIRYLILDITSRFYRNDFLFGVIEILIGIFIIYQKELVISFIPFIFGLFIIISGISKFQDALDSFKFKYQYSWLYLILAIISIIFGILVLLNPFDSAKLLFIVIGVGLLYSGISDLFTTIYLASKIKKFL